jgi:hypothetical protein
MKYPVEDEVVIEADRPVRTRFVPDCTPRLVTWNSTTPSQSLRPTLYGRAQADDQQRHATGHSRNPQHWRKRQRLLSICRRVQGTDVDDGFATRIGDALINERHQSDHDQDQTNDCNGFHGIKVFVKFFGARRKQRFRRAPLT